MNQREVSRSRISDLGEWPRAGLSMLLLLLAAVYFTTSLHEPLMYWHLAIGYWLREFNSMPLVNRFSILSDSLPLYLNSWFFAALLSYLYANFGFIALLLLKFSLILLFLTLLWWRLLVESRSGFIAALLALTAAAGVLVRSQLLPELLGLSLFLILIAPFRYRERPPRSLVLESTLLLAAVFLAANTLPLLLLCTALAYGLSTLFLVFTAARGGGRFTLRLVIALVSAAALYFSPYAGGNLTALLTELVTYIRLVLISGSDAATLGDYRTAVLFLFAASFLALRLSSNKVVQRLEVLRCFLLLALACASSSLAPYLLVYAALLLARVFSQGNLRLGGIGEAVDYLYRVLQRLPAFSLAFFLLCALYVLSVNRLRHPASALLLPKAELDWLLEQQSRQELMPLHHPPALGGYILYRFWKLDDDERLLDRTVLDAGQGERRAAAIAQLQLQYPEAFEWYETAARGGTRFTDYLEGVLAAKTAIVYAGSLADQTLKSNPSWCALPQMTVEWRLYASGVDCQSLLQEKTSEAS